MTACVNTLFLPLPPDIESGGRACSLKTDVLSILLEFERDWLPEPWRQHSSWNHIRWLLARQARQVRTYERAPDAAAVLVKELDR